MGSTGTRTPRALHTALEIAAPGADHRRLAQADHAAVAFAVGLVEFDDDLADVAQPRQL